jgi:hypothetical protein
VTGFFNDGMDRKRHLFQLFLPGPGPDKAKTYSNKIKYLNFSDIFPFFEISAQKNIIYFGNLADN